MTFESHGMKRRDVFAAPAALRLPEGFPKGFRVCRPGAAAGLADRGGEPVGGMELQGEGSKAAFEERLLEAEG